MKMELRDYQLEALDRVEKAEARGVKRQLGVAATGLGKTVMFCALAEKLGGRTLILAHRDELISQAAAKVLEVWPDAEVGVVKAERNEVASQVVVASVQTLARPSRLRQLLAPFADDQRLLGRTDPFRLVVVDEFHHAAASTYRGILDALGCNPEVPVEWERPLMFGVTATPDRGDGKGLDDIADEIVFSYDILWGIRSGYLCDVRGKQVKLSGFDESALKVSKGDYEAGGAGRALSDADAPAAIVKAWNQQARGRRTLVFTPTVALAQEVADAFVADGTRAAMVHGGTPLDERRALLKKFSHGEIDVVANCAVLTEGYDNPRVDCIVIARPTKSRALYTQCIGRGTRKHPDKADLLVLDVVGASAEHSLVTIPSLFGLEQEFRKRGEKGETPVSELVAEQEQHFVKVGRISAKEVELFDRVRSSGIAWVRLHKDGEPVRYVRGLGRNKATVVIANSRTFADDPEMFVVGLLYPDGSKRTLMDGVSLEMAQGVGEDHVRKFSDAIGLHDTAAPWRKRPPSAKALGMAKKWHVKVEKDWNAGQLSDAIDAKVTASEIRKAEKARREHLAERVELEERPAAEQGGSWVCETCGPHSGHRSNWCGLGCGRAGRMVRAGATIGA